MSSRVPVPRLPNFPLDASHLARYATRVPRRRMEAVRSLGVGRRRLSTPARSCCFESLESRELLAAQLLPDLQPWANTGKGYLYDWQIDTRSMPGHTLLRLTAANANVGAGVMQLIGGAANGDGTQQVNQRIYNDDGTF